MAVAILTDVYNEARAYLNDTLIARWTDAALLPYSKMAYDELQNKLSQMGLPATAEISADLTIPANTVRVAFTATTPVLPADLYEPIQLMEKKSGDLLFEPMERRDWEPDQIAGAVLGFWAWRELELKFPACSSDRVVKVRYSKFLPALTTGTDEIKVLAAKSFLAAKTAALASTFGDHNPSRGEILHEQAMNALYVITGTAGKRIQPARRLPFGFHRRLNNYRLRRP